jgi:hypothetical protein
MGERVTNGNFADDYAGWSCSDKTTECCDVMIWEEYPDKFCVMEACNVGCVVWFSQSVDLSNVPLLKATLLWYLGTFDPAYGYLRVYIDSTLVWGADHNPSDFETVSIDTSAYTGSHVVKFALHGSWDYYAFAEFSLVSAIGSDIPPAPVAAFTGYPTTGVAPLEVLFTDESTNTPTSWLWSFGDGTLSTVQHPWHTYANPGTYNVNLKATNAGGFGTIQKNNYILVTTPPASAALLWKFQFGPA